MDETQKKLWETQQEILDVIHDFCVHHNIRYSLAYGTLLGAVRHQSFIPWDDDLDVMMLREDYERFLALWETSGPQGYLLETDRTTDDYVNNFAKIRKDHTTFIQYEGERSEKHHKGIFVDIFPLDRCAGGFVSPKIQYLLFALNLLYNRGYTSGRGGWMGKAERLLLKIVPKSAYRRLSLFYGRLSRSWNTNRMAELVSPCTFQDLRRFYPSNLFDEFTELPFHGKKYCAVKQYDTFLKIRYGDYMQLPPEEERVWKHRPLLIDFEHNYEELSNRQI